MKHPSRIANAALAASVVACSARAATVSEVNDAGNDVGTSAAPDSARADDAATDAAALVDARADAGSAADSDGGVPVCNPSTTYGGNEAKIYEGTVIASLVDETGAVLPAGVPLFICGLDVCAAPAMTTGAASVSVSTSLSMKRPAFKFGDALTYAEFGIPLTTSATDFTTMGTGKLATAKLADSPGAALTAGAPATSGDVTITPPNGSTVSINLLVYATSSQQLFHAVSIPVTNAALLLPKAPTGFALLYGVAPVETMFCPAAEVTVALPASLGWQAGAAVEFWITTTDAAQTYAPYAGWALMSDGVVSANGKTATTTPGQGFATLENFALRLKQ